jgi:hypothetical protein
MTTVSEIAQAADVPVESVLRVLNREIVSSDVLARVLDVMERYGYGRLHGPGGGLDGSGAKPVAGELVGPPLRQAAVGPAANAAFTEQDYEAPDMSRLADRVTIMDALLQRLAADVEAMKQEGRRARGERLEDITVLVDLITTSWRAVDRRLGRIDRKLERLEGRPD